MFFAGASFAGLAMWDAAYREFWVRWETLSVRDRFVTIGEISVAVSLGVAAPVAKYLLLDRCAADGVGESACLDVIAVLAANGAIVILYYDFLIKFPMLQYEKRATMFGAGSSR